MLQMLLYYNLAYLSMIFSDYKKKFDKLKIQSYTNIIASYRVV